jgi:hypothetical protein
MRCEAEFVLEKTSYINSSNKDLAEDAFSVIMDYLNKPFTDLNSRKARKILRRIKKIGGPYAQQIIKVASQSVTDKSIDDKIRYAVEKAHVAEKEFHEAREFYKKTKPIFFDYFQLGKGNKLDYVVDFCSGNGLNGLYWLLQEAAEKVIFADITDNSHFRELRHWLWPDRQRYEYSCTGIDNCQIPEGKTIITAIHACGDLTDKTISLAVKNSLPFAVMPCCYDLKQNSPIDENILEYFSVEEDCIDIARIMKIQHSGYQPMVREIPIQITDKNRIIIGLK